jgi:hypothetical protein
MSPPQFESIVEGIHKESPAAAHIFKVGAAAQSGTGRFAACLLVLLAPDSATIPLIGLWAFALTGGQLANSYLAKRTSERLTAILPYDPEGIAKGMILQSRLSIFGAALTAAIPFIIAETSYYFERSSRS